LDSIDRAGFLPVIWQWSIWLYLKGVYLIGWTFTGDLAVVYLAVFETGLFDRLDFYR
jgi:hypothetical protein